MTPDTTYIEDLGSLIIGTINNIIVPVVFTLAFIVFIWGVFLKYILAHGDAAKVKQGHQLILWGLIGFAVMLSIWGLVNLVVATFGLDIAGPTSSDLPGGPEPG